MRFLFLACFPKQIAGGAEKSIINLANWTADNYSDDEVILASVEGDKLPYTLNDNVIFYGNRICKTKIFTHLSMLINTLNIVFKIKPDIIVGFWIHPLFYALPIKFLKKVTVVYSARNDPAIGYSKIARIMRCFVTRFSDACVFQTNDAMNFFSNYVIKKSKVIFNPTYINADDYPLPPKRRDVIVNVGRLAKQKNQSLLIRAFAEVHKLYPQMQLEIYGEGELRDELQRLIDDLGLKKFAFLKGATPEVINKVYGARLFVLSSDYEGMPNALIEAMSVGTPVISTDCPCGGPRELIKDGDNGMLVPVGDVKELSRRIVTMLNTDGDKFAQKGKKTCDMLNYNKIFHQWLDFIMEKTNE